MLPGNYIFLYYDGRLDRLYSNRTFYHLLAFKKFEKILEYLSTSVLNYLLIHYVKCAKLFPTKIKILPGKI